MGIRCGIVGLPNVGKSTLFNALTNSSVAAENFPFCTISPNYGTAAIPDQRLQTIADLVGVETIVPATIEFVDIAGLVEGASRGEGLGNQFLAHIREMDLIIHVIGAFQDENDASSEAETVNLELILADLETVNKAIDKSQRRARTGDKQQATAVVAMKRIQTELEKGNSASAAILDSNELEFIESLHLLSIKPKFYVVNESESDLSNQINFKHLSIDASQCRVCAEFEAELARLPRLEQEDFRFESGYSESALERICKSIFSALGLCTFFTFNEKEVRAWTISQGATARQAAGMVHTDMERGFIRAEIMPYQKLLQYGSEQTIKNAGELRFEGQDYQPEDGDIIRIRFNV